MTLGKILNEATTKIKYKVDKRYPNIAKFKYKGEEFEMNLFNDGSVGIFVDIAGHRTHLFDVDAENFDEAIDQFVYRYKG